MSTSSAQFVLVPPTARRRGLRWLLAFLVFGLLLWAVYQGLISSARERINDQLAKRGLVLRSERQTWSLWGGITLEKAALEHTSAGEPPLLEIGELHVDLLWRDFWDTRRIATRWQAEDTTLVLRDEEGAVTLHGFSTDFTVAAGQAEFTHLEATEGPLTIALTGTLFTSPPSPGESPREFYLRLRPLRATLTALQFTPGTGPFRVTGRFTVDRRTLPMTWTSDLKGEGQDVEWRGLPLCQALVTGRASDAGLDLTCDLQLLTGSSRVKLTRESWQPGPLLIAGTLTDSTGRTDEFQAHYLGGEERTLTVARLEGPADVLELARTYPPLAERIPTTVQVKTFPDLLLTDLVWPLPRSSRADWSLGRLQLRSPASLILTVRDHPLAVDQLTGAVSRQDSLWRFDDLQGRLLDGHFTLDALSYDGETLKKAKLSLKSLRLARLSPWLGKISDDLAESDLSLTYNGSVCNQPIRSTGSGSLVLTEAPVVHIPLIEQAYTLFPKVLPDRGRAGVGSFQVRFTMSKGVATIDPFKARSNSVTVTAKGTVDLVKRRVEGKARANLRGIVGRITLPLSHVFTDMEVSGPLDDIQVTPEGPIGGVKSLLKGTSQTATTGAKLSSKVLREGLKLPFEALGMFKDEAE